MFVHRRCIYMPTQPATLFTSPRQSRTPSLPKQSKQTQLSQPHPKNWLPLTTACGSTGWVCQLAPKQPQLRAPPYEPERRLRRRPTLLSRLLSWPCGRPCCARVSRASTVWSMEYVQCKYIYTYVNEFSNETTFNTDRCNLSATLLIHFLTTCIHVYMHTYTFAYIYKIGI